jgi:hypothetical protein
MPVTPSEKYIPPQLTASPYQTNLIATTCVLPSSVLLTTLPLPLRLLLTALILPPQPINAIHSRIPEAESPEEPVVRVSSAVAECPVVAAAVVADASAVGSG